MHFTVTKRKIKIHFLNIFNLYYNKERIDYKMVKISSATYSN